MYKKYLSHTYKLGKNIVCTCCSCISHDIMEFNVPHSYDLLHHWHLPENVHIPFDCGIDVLNQNCILIASLELHKTSIFFYVVYVTINSPRIVSPLKDLQISNVLG